MMKGVFKLADVKISELKIYLKTKSPDELINEFIGMVKLYPEVV